MPPKGAKPLTTIKRVGDMDTDFTLFESEEFSNMLKESEKKIEIMTKEASDATVSRRLEQQKDENHITDFQDAKKYLLRKIQDKESKIKFYTNKLKEIRQKRETLLADLQSKADQLKQSQELELTQLNNNLKANKARRDGLATVAALEKQLNREIAEAEETLKTEKQQQSAQMSMSFDEFYKLLKRHEQELHDEVEREKQKNRSMTVENLEKTVIDMMNEITTEKNNLYKEVFRTRATADKNTELTERCKHLYMSRDLLLKETDELNKAINKNDSQIRKLMTELKEHDQKISDENQEEHEEEKTDVEVSVRADLQEGNIQEQDVPDREKMLNTFFIDCVNTLCQSIVRILQILDEPRADDYTQFHSVFTDFEGRKKELRFLMSKLGNLTFDPIQQEMLPPMGLTGIDGADEEYTRKNLVEPQNQAISQFAKPIGDDEYPDLIATHFFQ